MIKEKIIFWPLVAVFIGVLIFGFLSQGKKKEATQELMQEIELATKKSRAKKKAQLKDMWDFDIIKTQDAASTYEALLERSPFFRVRHEPLVKVVEPLPVKEEKKEPILKYKGKVVMGEKIMVVIEDQGIGKSHFVEAGDKVGDFKVLRIGEKEVALQKQGGEEIILKAKKQEP